MNHRCQCPAPKNATITRRRIPLAVPLSSVFLFLFLVSHFVATTTVVVIATDDVNGEKNGVDSIKEIEENEDLSGKQERQTLFSSYDVHEKEEITIDININNTKEGTSSVGTTDDSKISEENFGDASDKRSDSSSNKNEIREEKEISQNDDHIEVGDGIEKSTKENEIEDTIDSSLPSLSEKIQHDIKENIDKPLDENEIGEIKNDAFLTSDNEMKDPGFQNDSVIGNKTTSQESKEEEKEIPSIASSSSTENSSFLESEKVRLEMGLGDEFESHEPNLEREEKPNASISSSSEKTTKTHPETIEKKKDMEGSPTGDISDEDSNRSSGSSTKKTKDEEIQQKAMMGNESVEMPLRSHGNTKKMEDAEEEKEQQESSTYNAASSDSQPNVEKEADIQDENPSSLSNTTQTFPVYDSSDTNDDSYLDLDLYPEGLNTSAPKGEKIIGKEEDTENHLHSVIIEDENNENIIRGVNLKALARARARARKDIRSTGTAKTSTSSEIPIAETTNSYRGEPWGTFRSTRRLPDLELLRLVFENANKTRSNIASGDVKSQNVVNDWRKDPLYDEKMPVDVGSQEPILGDEEDEQFLNYRSRLLGENDDGPAGANVNIKSKAINDKTGEDRHDKKTAEIGNDNEINSDNGYDNNADVNAEFVEGLDDIDKFFEGVDPPDELDVGYGSSIQDVLMDKGKHILLKKIRRVGHWIKTSFQTMGRKVEERISEFQLPFQKAEETTNIVSDFDEEGVNSTSSTVTSVQRDQIVKRTRETLISAWKVGKQTVELISDLVDGLLDRFDGRSEDDSTNFEDFNGFDLDNLSTFPPPA